ncbi:MAG TPA: ATP-binding protein [Opitutaceae bacterium]|nr:ATP-binding protein [Opitutaceae bacterium]
MNPRLSRLALPVAAAGVLLVAIFAAMVIRLRAELRAQIRQQIIDRAAEVLRPIAQRQLAAREAVLAGRSAGPADMLAAVLENARQEDMLAMVVYDAQGRVLRVAPDSLLYAELPIEQYLQLLKGESISRYDPAFPLERYFTGMGTAPRPTPVLEVLLPLHGGDAAQILGFVQYYIDGRSLAAELAALDRRIDRQTAVTLGTGALLIAAVLAATAWVLRRAQRTLAERNERLARANYELALAAKTSALGQITSHLLHGLQGSVAGLRAAVDGRGAEGAAADWESVAAYTGRMQAMIHETIALLSDVSTQAAYELTGAELAEIVRRHNAAAATQKGVVFSVDGGFPAALDSHRGSLLCLIASNLVQNAIEATDAGRRVGVTFGASGGQVAVTVADEGPGIPAAIREHLFEPGRSGRPGGSGLGLAISQLLARQIGATLELDSTGPGGTSFSLFMPVGDQTAHG